MADINTKCYGSFGWRQFWQNRIELLKEYDRLKALNINQPVRTSHGVALEGKIREWLGQFLPKKYAVTSGYIIPDIVVGNYSLRHFDVIIYNQLESPVLWIETTADNSETGAKKAIPAKYVHAVFEVKATFTKQHIQDSIDKLNELTGLKDYLPPDFYCASIFAEIGSIPKNLSFLEDYSKTISLIHFIGSLILRNDADETSSGTIEIHPDSENVDGYPNVPFTRAMDDLNIYANDDGTITVNDQFAGLSMTKINETQFSFTKLYGPVVTKDKVNISVMWSHNSFTRFLIKILNGLEGRSINDNENNFGEVYDKIYLKKKNEDNNEK